MRFSTIFFIYLQLFAFKGQENSDKMQKVMRLHGNRIAFERKYLRLIVTFCVETKNIGLNAKLLLHLYAIYLGNQRNYLAIKRNKFEIKCNDFCVK